FPSLTSPSQQQLDLPKSYNTYIIDVEINPSHSHTTSQNALYKPFPFSPIPTAAINKPGKDSKFHLYQTITPTSVILRFVDKLNIKDRAKAIAKQF
ncbi:hypothetical protein RB213_002152, partial [Colletotrichum asianum]